MSNWFSKKAKTRFTLNAFYVDESLFSRLFSFDRICEENNIKVANGWFARLGSWGGGGLPAMD